MLYYKNNEYHISDLTISYIQDDEELENTVGSEGKQWWVEFEEKWDDMEIVEFADVETSEEQAFRLEEINKLSIPEGHSTVVGNYVNFGSFPDLPNHVLKDLQFTKMFNIMLGVE